MDVSRLYTVLAGCQLQPPLHVSQVITPTVALVCQRDREIAGFTPSHTGLWVARRYACKMDSLPPNGYHQRGCKVTSKAGA
nr:hypothetical protein [Klebsiella pneumoniae]